MILCKKGIEHIIKKYNKCNVYKNNPKNLAIIQLFEEQLNCFFVTNRYKTEQNKSKMNKKLRKRKRCSNK